MIFNILNHAIAYEKDLETILARPTMRKATRNMAFGVAAMEKALEPYPHLAKEYGSEFGLILSTHTGELHTTLDFLNTFYSTKVARPLLFQNSLHNATTGFLAIQYGLRGPALTVSSLPFGEEQALDTANLLVTTGQCRFCVVISVDVWPKIEGITYDKNEIYDAASCFILCNSDEEKYPARAILNQFAVQELSVKDETHWAPVPQSQNSLFVLSQNLEARTEGSLRVEKKYGSTHIEWSSSL